MAVRDPALQTKRDRGDLATAIGVGALAIGFLLFDGVRQITELFSAPDAVTVRAPASAQTITADIADGVPASTDIVILSVEDVNVVSIVSLLLGVVISTLGLIATAVFATLVCRRLLRNVVFDRVNTRLAFAASVGLLVAGLGGMWFHNMGLNGVFAAIGGEFDGQTALLMDAIPTLIAAFAVGVLVIVFRRGSVLQKDTEGLV
ncbi:hypothetical protein [Microbacterium aerolatum]|uniref:DUF2975 domain-containing protein n=1 Tax=Microbacterium aerolatum TaxID=153731 RepID=A0A511AIY5_9MICO|nr:hypothetical protein [Microbacterium aerolatum]MCK3769431.1 hypothetical protein [Microbacterium aerolatum]GEK86711.1 hypothetical protein MAE01_18870 [Microbacterium aerolatum]GGB19114.1 hypothetical protein GCM10007198_07050 [Microbacterium aerolatum]